jgi:hypothetical protein
MLIRLLIESNWCEAKRAENLAERKGSQMQLSEANFHRNFLLSTVTRRFSPVVIDIGSCRRQTKVVF